MSLERGEDPRTRTGTAARQAEATKEAILQSVARIVSEEGAGALTIDEVAKSAALSKGGVLHHFPSKEALLLAAFAHDLDSFEEEVARLQQEDPATPGAYTRAYLRACVESFGPTGDDCLTFLHQFRAIPSTVRLVRSYKERWMHRVEQDGLNPAIANLVRYVGDGIWLASTAAEAKPASFDEMVELLLRLAGTDDGDGRPETAGGFSTREQPEQGVQDDDLRTDGR